MRIKITTPGYYWLTFASDGTNDSYGWQIDDIRLCQELCPGTPQDNFPAGWTAANNSGVIKTLFEDTFESPTYTTDPHTKGGNLGNSLGTSGTSSSGWPAQPASGWAVAPYNQVNYIMQSAPQGSQYISMDGYNASGSGARDRVISRPFLLDPGYYQVTYQYAASVLYVWNTGSNYCTAAPSSGLLDGLGGPSDGNRRPDGALLSATDTDTNLVGVFFPNGQLVSTPIIGGALSSTTTYTNPDGTVSTTPTVPPDVVNYQHYDATQVSPLIDFCSYSYAWVPRQVAVKSRSRSRVFTGSRPRQPPVPVTRRIQAMAMAASSTMSS